MEALFGVCIVFWLGSGWAFAIGLSIFRRRVACYVGCEVDRVVVCLVNAGSRHRYGAVRPDAWDLSVWIRFGRIPLTGTVLDVGWVAGPNHGPGR